MPDIDRQKTHSGSKKKLYDIDGKKMTIDEIAAMLGITQDALMNHKIRQGCSYSTIVQMYRDGRLCSVHDKWPRHCVHGRWITAKQAAEELGCTVNGIRNWRNRNRNHDGTKRTLEEAYDYFHQYQTGERKRGGREPKKHKVRGHMMTVAEAAKKYNISETALRIQMSRFHRTLDAAIKRLEERRIRTAQKEIMEILMGGNKKCRNSKKDS